MKNLFKPLAKNLLLSSELIGEASGTDAAIPKKVYRSGMTTLIIYNEETGNIMKTVKYLKVWFIDKRC